jgi:ATP-dependent Clp protease protease subunit
MTIKAPFPIFNAVTPIRKPVATPAPAATGYRVVARSASNAEIYLYGTVGSDWFGDGVTAKQFSDDVKALGSVKNIDLHINSDGGDVFQGKTIYSILVDHPARITTRIDGLAASIASLIAMAGDEIVISEGGFVMIHNAWTFAMGDAAGLRKTADLLETVSGTILDTYVARTKGDRAKIQQMMDDETWMTGAEAVANGFADKMVENLKVAARIAHPKAFQKLPAALKPNVVRARKALERIAALKA